jgi:hypothetical protein
MLPAIPEAGPNVTAVTKIPSGIAQALQHIEDVFNAQE